MKSTFVVSLLLLTITAINAMENNQPIDYKAIHQLLRSEYKQYVTNRLKEYKKNDSIDMNKLIEVGLIMTKSTDVIEQLLDEDVKDENDNRFIHIATKKADVDLVRWLLRNGDKNCMCVNADQEYSIDLCIKQLLPAVIDTGAKSRQIFDLMIPYVAQFPEEYDSFKHRCLKKIITLQLKHTRYNNNGFPVNKELLQSLVPQLFLEHQPPMLSLLYKETVDDTDGNALSHILVEQENPDALYELAKTHQISWVKNKNEHNVFDMAAIRFREAIKDIDLVGSNAESITRRGCCLYILMHYLRNEEIKNGATNVEAIGTCCEKHILQ